MRVAWLGGLSDGTPCGRGSTLENTKAIRDELPRIAEKYGIKTVCDAGAGDLHWMRHVVWDVEYQGFDLIPRHKDVKALDITLDVLPECDLILCRFVLGHLDPANVMKALRLFKWSGKYLLASNPEKVDYNSELYGTFNKWDLRIAPFNFGEPLETYGDSIEHNLCLWAL